MRVTTEEAPPVVVVNDGRGYVFPVRFNHPPTAATLTTVLDAAWREQYRIKVRPGER